MKSRQRSYLWILSIIGVLILTVGITSPVLAETPAWTITKVPVGDFSQGDVNKIYTITVTNSGGVATTGLVTVTDTLPIGLVAQSISSLDPAWTCPTGNVINLTELTCTRTAALDSTASSVITVVVDVALDAGDIGTDYVVNPLLYRTVTNTVTVSGGGSLDPATDSEITPILQKPDLRILSWEYWNEAKTEKLTGNLPANQSFWVKMILENRGGANTAGFYTGVFLDGGPNFGPDHEPLGGDTDWVDYQVSPQGCVYYVPGGVGAVERGNYTQSDFLPEIPGYSGPTDVYVHIAYPTSEPDYSTSVYDNIRNGLSAGAYNLVLYADPTCLGPQESFENNNVLGPIPLNIGAPVEVKIGSLVDKNYLLPLHGSTRQSYAGINSGPVDVTSNENIPIIAAERVIYNVGGVPTSFSEMMGLPNSQVSNTYWLPWYNNVDLDTQLRFGNVSGSPATVHVYIGGVEMSGSPFSLTASGVGQSTRVSFAGINNGPVRIVSNVSIVAAERVIYNVGGVPTSFSEMLALPNSQLDTTYLLPWYNNVDLDTQLRFGNVSGSPATVHVYIGGVEMPGSPFSLTASGVGQSTRVSFAGINNGPVRIVSNVSIVAAERVIYNVGGVPTSFSEMMGLPNSQVSNTYWLPWYNNVDLDTQLRFGNVSGSPATVHVYIGGVEMSGSPFSLTASGVGQSTRVSFAGINNGPVRIVSNVSIVAAERVIYNVGGVPTSFSEMMGLPSSQLDTTYLLPWYNNVDLDTQLRFGVP